MQNCHRSLGILALLVLSSCRPSQPQGEAPKAEEEATLPPGVIAPPMTPAQQKVSDEVTAALHGPLIEKAMGEFRAMHDRFPKDHEEFMSSIIEANAIELPPEPPGKRYQYDSERHVLELVNE